MTTPKKTCFLRCLDGKFRKEAEYTLTFRVQNYQNLPLTSTSPIRQQKKSSATVFFLKAIDLHIANHLRLADEDLKAAQVLIKAGNRFGAYHAEQAAEKILLALITSEQTHVERKDAHRLDVLRDKLPDENPFKARFQSLVYLTAYATTFRYPKEGGRLPAQPSEEEIDEGVAKIKSILDDAVKHFGVDINASDNFPAKNSAPPRIQ